jgi:hypothetical protein
VRFSRHVLLASVPHTSRLASGAAGLGPPLNSNGVCSLDVVLDMMPVPPRMLSVRRMLLSASISMDDGLP